MTLSHTIKSSFFKGSRSFNSVNMGSVDRRTTKLLAFKVGEFKKKSAASGITAEVSAWILVHLGQIILKV